REQIKLQVALITPLAHVKGYAAPETKAAVERARLLIKQAEALGEPTEDPLLLFVVLYGFWAANYLAFNGDALRELSSQFLTLAEKQAAGLVVGHRLMAGALLHMGDIVQSRPHYEQAIALYDPAKHRSLAARFGQDARVAALSFRSWAMWMLGYPQAGLSDADQAIQEAREIGQSASLMFAMVIGSFPMIFCGNYAKAKAVIDEVAALADEKGALLWKASGIVQEGCLLTLTGKASDAVQIVTSGIAAWRSMGATVWTPIDLSYLARAYAELGQFRDAWRCIDEAVTAIEATGERWCEADVHRLAGELALTSPESDETKVQ